MSTSKTAQLYDLETSIGFYENRYRVGYMTQWPVEKRKRISDVVRSLDLPRHGTALDFGCGNGVLTEVLQSALPQWQVYGADISKNAVENASRMFSGCKFFVLGDAAFARAQFDFVFSHHVLEHVHSLSGLVEQMSARVSSGGTMLHILPCGNAGSLEHSVCLLRSDGINPALENRFFFEDEGHVRRLTSEALSSLFNAKGFRLAREYYSCQHYGALDWITLSGAAFVRQFTDWSHAVNIEAGKRLRSLRARLLPIAYMRSVIPLSRQYFRRPSWRRVSVLPLLLPLYPLGMLVDLYYRNSAKREWRTQRDHRNGSEMYLFFEREQK